MQFPLELRLRPSRMITALVLVVHLAAALALFHVPSLAIDYLFVEAGPALLLAGLLAWAALFASLLFALRAERFKRGCTLWLEDDGLIELNLEGAETGVLCRVRPHSAVVFHWAVWFRLLAVEPVRGAPSAGPWWPSAMMLVAANVPEHDWRLLRIWLRHCADRQPPVLDSPR